ncbi:tRNA-histidine guanylyltransferase 1-like [Chytridiales sp. JEL 0842]|nr:tRNA-histidine guanylyltransferase 1-like [Chytridiales sp. JEL 0842]
MAKSKFEYVKTFEQHNTLLPNTWIVVRVDGHSFHKFTAEHGFEKPNDIRALHLANSAAEHVMNEMQDIVMAYGESDEFSFLFRKRSQLYKRREAKIMTNLVSLFTSYYVMNWKKFFPHDELKYAPSFDSRTVLYPSDQNMRDYFSWRQADCHINNLYNTAFWALVQDKNDPKTEREAESILKDTDSAGKNELLFSRFNVNYNSLPAIYRKGSILIRRLAETTKVTADGVEIPRKRVRVFTEHCDIIGDQFWKDNPQIFE